jgi:Arc/MetJ-type ribon-helix-helix transcriptional regulator
MNVRAKFSSQLILQAFREMSEAIRLALRQLDDRDAADGARR